ncbi:hypothetical protein KJ664_01525 [Patescibacteria group bacterium]|nr:hypothetical protein [Patescibacteria group bacterium]
MIKKNIWLIINAIFLAVFAYAFVGIYACKYIPFYDSRDIRDPFFWGVYGNLSCSLGYALGTAFLTFAWAGSTLLGLTISWFKKCLKKNLKISLLFVLIWGAFWLFSYARGENRVKALEKEQRAKQELGKELEDITKTKEVNSQENYIVNNCTDALADDKDNVKVIKITCAVFVKIPGNYLVVAKLLPANYVDDGFDNVLIESNSTYWDLKDQNVVVVYLNYRHLVKTKIMPDGPYSYRIELIPTGEIENKLFPYTHTGITIGSYLGTIFNGLPFLSVQ